MPRFSRPIPGGICAHVVTRGNARATIFRLDADYREFISLISSATDRVPIDVLAWCIMPNHVHLVMRPRNDGDLARWMHWILTSHVQRHRARYSTTGRIWQGRYKAFPIQADTHLLMVLRYVERNPVRASLVRRAAEWPWSSASIRTRAGESPSLLAPSPVPLPDSWLEWVDVPLTQTELAGVRTSVSRARPYGDPAWTRGLAERLDLLGTMAPHGRPRTL